MSSTIPLEFPNLALIQEIPKIELHAHLSGSVPKDVIQELIQQRRTKRPDRQEEILRLPDSSSLSLEECWQVFHVLHQVLDNLDSLKIATKAVIESFAADGVIYLELRTTPRCLSVSIDSCDRKESKDSYIETIIQVIQSCEKECRTSSGFSISVRLLLSVDRGQSIDEAWETLALAQKYRNMRDDGGEPYIVGLDFSGNPAKEPFSSFLAVFEAARKSGLFLSIHCAEILNDSDTTQILNFKPDRFGHMCCLSDTHWVT